MKAARQGRPRDGGLGGEETVRAHRTRLSRDSVPGFQEAGLSWKGDTNRMRKRGKREKMQGHYELDKLSKATSAFGTQGACFLIELL